MTVPVELPSREEIKGYECKHGVYVQASDGSKDDLVVVKEIVHTKDGRLIPNLRFFLNFKRDFYVTKEPYRNHNEKKEWEDVAKLQKFTTTQSKMAEAIARALGKPGTKSSLRMLGQSRYLYGSDITTPVLIKHKYMVQYPDCISENRVSVLDIETDVVKGTEEIISISLTYKDRAVLVYTKDFLGTVPNAIEETHRQFELHLGEFKRKRNISLEVLVTDTPAQAVLEVINRAHAWMPDFVAIWNIDYDLPKIIAALEKEGYNLADVFSDPRVPPRFRYCRYVQGADQKVTATGKITPLHPADRWHTLECPASWYAIDAMCVYKKIRVAKGNEASYSLDYILNKILKVRKLKFDDILEKEAPHIKPGSLKWHEFMQTNYRIEYGIYNLFDCISVEELDQETGDLRSTLSVLVEHSEYHRFPSQPRRTADDLHFFCEERNKIIAATGSNMEEELDKHIVSMNGWIVTLPAHLVDDNGLQIINEFPELRTSIRAHVADLDVSGAYPNTQDLLNMSKETTYRELCRIEGIPETTQRRTGINLTGGTTNAVEIGCEIFGLPSFDVMLSSFVREHNLEGVYTLGEQETTLTTGLHDEEPAYEAEDED